MTVPVLSVIRDSYGVLARHPRASIVCLGKGLLAIAAIILVTIGLTITANGVAGSAMGQGPLPTLIAGVALLAIALVMICVQTSFIRLAYFGANARMGLRFAAEERATVRAYFKLFLLQSIVIIALMLPCALLAWLAHVMTGGNMPPYLSVPLVLICGLLFLWVNGRVYPIWPAAAVGQSLTLREAYELSRGNGWRIVLAVLPNLLLLGLLASLQKSSLGAKPAVILLSVLLNIVILVTLSTALGSLYKHLSPPRD